MSACLDINGSVDGDVGLHIEIPQRYIRKGRKHVDCCNGGSCFLHAL